LTLRRRASAIARTRAWHRRTVVQDIISDCASAAGLPKHLAAGAGWGHARDPTHVEHRSRCREAVRRLEGDRTLVL